MMRYFPGADDDQLPAPAATAAPPDRDARSPGESRRYVRRKTGESRGV